MQRDDDRQPEYVLAVAPHRALQRLLGHDDFDDVVVARAEQADDADGAIVRSDKYGQRILDLR